jgi:hypothetical protein
MGCSPIEERSQLAPDYPVSFSLVVLATRGDAWDRSAIVGLYRHAPAPACVVGRHSDDEATNLRKRVGPSEAPPRIRPFPGDQLAVPAQNGVSRDDRGHLRQQPTTERRATSRQAPSVAIGEPQTLILQLRLQHAVLFAQVLDDLMLVALEPTDESGDEQLQWDHAPSLRHLGRTFWTLRVLHARDRVVETSGTAQRSPWIPRDNWELETHGDDCDHIMLDL